MAESYDQTGSRRDIKLVVVGDGTVGKTCLCYTYKQGSFPDDDAHRPTIFDNSYIDLSLDGHHLNLNVWDTAGQEEFERLRPLMYPKTDVFLLCYAIDNVTSFNNIMIKWAPELRKHCPNARIMLVATKADCRGSDPQTNVERARGRKLAVGKLKADGFIECSARTGEGVAEAFETAVRTVLYGPQLGSEGCVCTLV
ncbi:Ras-related protein ced-10 [Amphibalanus amphitrite]|uniref:Ras-related protein ced-10 n=1 Tax=Amphibalanus amphitrite TaxID=1232801 RepID=A0A6A4XCR3_AMPAM|nr:Ras-related protein ced-10 [Amphibalanus amphitrite]